MVNSSLAIKPTVEIFKDKNTDSCQKEKETHKVVPLHQPEEHKYIYVLVRNDLSDAQKAVQSAHAAIEASRQWLVAGDEHPSVIICVVKSEAKLLACAEKLKSEGLDFVLFREPDIGYQATALASCPIFGDDRQHFARFQLLHARTN